MSHVRLDQMCIKLPTLPKKLLLESQRKSPEIQNGALVDLEKDKQNNSAHSETNSSPIFLTAWQPGPGDKTQYEGPDMPSADLPESHMGTEPVPLPPEVSKLPKIRGYEGTSHHATGNIALWTIQHFKEKLMP